MMPSSINGIHHVISYHAKLGNWFVTYLPSHVHLIHLIYQSLSIHLCTKKSNPFISISFILQIIVHLIHIHHIWFYSYCIIFQPYCVFHFFNQSRLWKLGVSFDKILVWNIYCIIWSWTLMVLLLLATS